MYSSNAILVQGINIPSEISVSWWEYSIDWWSYTSEDGIVTLWQSVRVRRTSSSSNATSTSVTLNIWWVTDTYTITTIAADTTPDTFHFSDITNAEPWVLYYSGDITVTWINIPVDINISWAWAEYSISDGVPQNTAQWWTATASSQYNTNNSPDRAFDGNTWTSGWWNNNQMPAWLRYDFWMWNLQRITRYTLYRSSTHSGGWNWNGYSPRNWTFEGSNDGSSWTVLDTQTNQTISTNANKREFSFDNTQYYRYYRINISSNNHWGSNWVNITEMELISEVWSSFTSAPWSVSAWDTVTLRMQSPDTPSSTNTTTLSIWDTSSDFNISTLGQLTSPDSFSLNDIFDADTSTMYESNTITVTWINTTIPIDISWQGEYSINEWPYTSNSWNIWPNDSVQVRLISPNSLSSTSSTTLTIGDRSAIFNISTPAPSPNTTPDSFSFTNISDASLLTLYNSETITISGINTSSPVTINWGEYRIEDGNFTSNSGNIENGQNIQLRVTSWSNPGDTRNVVLTIGWISHTWSVTTLAPDTTPDSFSFSSISSAQLSTLYESNTVTISWINAATPVSISGWGEYRINRGSWRSDSGEVFNGDSLQVRRISSSSGNTSTSTTLTVGWASPQTFTIITLVPDIDIDPFVFQYIQNATYSSPTLSDTIVLSWINTSVPISVTWWEYRIWTSWSFTSNPWTVSNWDELTVRLVSWSWPNIESSMSVDVWGYVTEFRVRTRSSIPPAHDPVIANSWVSVSGNYNGIFAHARDAENYYIIATPSIISYDLSNPDVEHILSERKLVYHWFQNLPESYRDNFIIVDDVDEDWFLENIPFIWSNTLIWNGWFDFRPDVPVLFTGTRSELAAYTWLRDIHEWIRTNYRNFIAYRDIAHMLDDHRLTYLERILSQFVGINPVRPYYCSDIKQYRLINNIAPDAEITASPSGFWSAWVSWIANWVISSEWSLDYEYHSESPNASIFFEWEDPQSIWYIKIFNRTWCCSERLSGAIITLYDESGQVLYTHPLWNTLWEFVVELDLEWINQMHFAKSMSIESVDNNYLNLREVEIYLWWDLRDWFYEVDRDGIGWMSSYQVYCDMTTDGGWWTRIWENYVSNGQLRNQNHAVQHTFGGYNDVSDNIIVDQSVETPPTQIPDAHVLRHNGGPSSFYEMLFDRVPGEFIGQEIRLSAWVRWTSTSIFHNRVVYDDGTESITQPESETIETSPWWWRLEQARIPLTWSAVDAFYWNAWRNAAWPFFMTWFEMEIYYR